MAKIYRSREGEATAVDTKTQLTTLGSETAPGPLLVPAGTRTLLGVWVAAESIYAAATGFNGFVRLEGAGLTNGPEVIAAIAGGASIATGGAGINRAEYYPLNVPVIPANEILVFAEMCGTDVGQVSYGVTLVFQ